MAQIIIKSRLTEHGAVPFSLAEGWPYLLGLLGDWRVWLGGFGLVASSVLWYAGISRIPLSLGFPFAALAYPLVFAGSVLFLHERFSWQSLAGNGLIVLGVVLAATRLP
ncbi:EamA family transporter [Mesorhizobium hawassense]|nr:EamA family transporter [Mesorhizobium hawassense]